MPTAIGSLTIQNHPKEILTVRERSQKPPLTTRWSCTGIIEVLASAASAPVPTGHHSPVWAVAISAEPKRLSRGFITCLVLERVVEFWHRIFIIGIRSFYNCSFRWQGSVGHGGINSRPFRPAVVF